MVKLKEFIKNNQQVIVLGIGYVLVAAIGFGLGQLTVVQKHGPEIKLDSTQASNTNYTPIVSGLQSEARPAECKIKATASSKIYHLPDQNGYDKLSGQVCFNSEEEAQAAGYRKALR